MFFKNIKIPSFYNFQKKILNFQTESKCLFWNLSKIRPKASGKNTYVKMFQGLPKTNTTEFSVWSKYLHFTL